MTPEVPPPHEGRAEVGGIWNAPEERWRPVVVRTALLVGLFVVAVLLLSGLSGPADARFPINNFTNVDDTATVTPSGQTVAVSGWVKCTEGHVAELSVTVVQDTTEATGRTHVRCLGQTEVQSWTIHVVTRDATAFERGRPVRVDARAVTRSRGERTDGPHTWTNDEVALTRR